MKTLHTTVIDLFLTNGASFENATEIADDICAIENPTTEILIWEVADTLMNYVTDSLAWIESKRVITSLLSDNNTPNVDSTIERLLNRKNSRIAA